MARRRRRTSLGESHEDPRGESLHHRGGQRRRFPWLFMLLMFLAVAIFFAPQIVTQTTLKDRLLQWALPAGAAHVEIGTARAGWLAPVSLQDVQVRDVQGQPMIFIEEVSTEKPLFEFVKNYRELGTIHIRNPHLQLIVTKDGSNLQEALATLTTSEKESSRQATSTSSPVSLGLEITNGKIDVADQVSGIQSVADNVNLTLHVPAANESELVLKLAANTIQGQQTGQLQADIQWKPPHEFTAKDLGAGQIVFQSNQFPLPILAPLLSRTVPDLRLDGQLNADLTCNWANQVDGPALRAAGELGIERGLFAMTSVLGNDEIRSEHITAQLDASIDHSQVRIQNLRTQSEFGELAVTGSAPLAELVAEDVLAQAMSATSGHQLQATGRVDLARLAQSLPETLRLRAGTNITEGTLELTASSKNAGQGRQVVADVTTTTLAGMSNGQSVRWDQPVQLHFIGRPVGQQWVVDRLEAQAEFLHVVANGSASQGQFQAKGDLGAMLSEVQKFADIGAVQLAGGFESSGDWQTDISGHVAGKTTANIRQFAMAYEGMPPWQESALTLSGSFAGTVQDQTVREIQKASASLTSGSDHLQIVLTQPVPQPSAETDWPFQAALQGRVESWLARLRPWVATGDWNVSGAIDATATGVGSIRAVALQPIDIKLADVRAAAGAQVLVDPEVKLVGALQWDQKTQRVTIPTATIASSTLAMRAQDVDISLAPESFSATGTTSFRADLQRLWTWTSDPTQPSTMVPQGLAIGSVRLSTAANQIQFVGETKVTDLIVNTLAAPTATTPAAWNRSWHESEVTLNASGTFDQPADLLRLDNLKLASDSLQVAAQGNIDKITSAPYAHVQGQLQYDWQRVLDKIRHQIGPQLQIVGQQNQPFQLRGPLTSTAIVANSNPTFPGQAPQARQPVVPPGLTAQVALGWDQANLYGVVLGAQQINARLEQGVVFAEPFSLALTNNTQAGAPQAAKLTMAPRVELNAQPMMLVLDQTTSAENIELTPELCAHWLKYVTPLMAGTATASGSLSARLAGARVPLTNPMAADLAGQVTIHQARVSPGPMAQQLLNVSQQVGGLIQKNSNSLSFLQAENTWLEIEQQQIEFQMSGGRVYHRNLEFRLGDAQVQSHGWVGLDQSIALEANIPILDKWIGDEKLLAGLRGKSVQIPIRGSFSQPELDQRALADISKQLIGSTAEQFIQGELQKGLQKLLGPK